MTSADPGKVSGTFTGTVTIAGGGTSACTNVTASDSAGTIIAANTSRLGAYFFNDSDKTCYLKLGAGATTSSFTAKVRAGAFYELPFPAYTGIVTGIWDTGPTGTMRVTEISP